MYIDHNKQWQKEQGKTPEERRAETLQFSVEFGKYAKDYLQWLYRVEAEARKSRIMVRGLDAA